MKSTYASKAALLAAAFVLVPASAAFANSQPITGGVTTAVGTIPGPQISVNPPPTVAPPTPSVGIVNVPGPGSVVVTSPTTPLPVPVNPVGVALIPPPQISVNPPPSVAAPAPAIVFLPIGAPGKALADLTARPPIVSVNPPPVSQNPTMATGSITIMPAKEDAAPAANRSDAL